MPFTLFDIALLVIMVLSGFLAMLRGLSREVLSIFSWGVAAGSAVYMLKYHPDLLSGYISSEKIAMAALLGSTFMVTLIISSLVTMKLSDAFLDSSMGALDRSLGFVFGMARGLVLVAILHVFYAFYYDKNPLPMVANAYSRPFVAATGESIKNVMIDIYENVKDRLSNDDDDA